LKPRAMLTSINSFTGEPKGRLRFKFGALDGPRQ
jgi:hypothetical protein